MPRLGARRPVVPYVLDTQKLTGLGTAGDPERRRFRIGTAASAQTRRFASMHALQKARRCASYI